ncbi:MAG: alanine racemase [Pseudomonadota bacterium]
MTAPRLEIDLGKITHNARCLSAWLTTEGVDVTGVTKGVCGRPEVARAMLDSGVSSLADARVENVERMRAADIACPISLIRPPMLSQAARVVRSCELSYNTEPTVIKALAAAARAVDKVHHVVLMVEMGDMRDGIMPADVAEVAAQVVATPGVALKGVGANFGCLSGVAPDADAMARLSSLADEVEGACGPYVQIVSGGGSASLSWAFGPEPKRRVNDLRLGEAILLGLDPTTCEPIDGLKTDAFALFAEVIEVKVKAERPLLIAVDPASKALRLVPNRHGGARSILALGAQDTDVGGLTTPEGFTCLGGTSDHLVMRSERTASRVGDVVELRPNYDALMRCMNAPSVAKTILDDGRPPRRRPSGRAACRLVEI